MEIQQKQIQPGRRARQVYEIQRAPGCQLL